MVAMEQELALIRLQRLITSVSTPEFINGSEPMSEDSACSLFQLDSVYLYQKYFVLILYST